MTIRIPAIMAWIPNIFQLDTFKILDLSGARILTVIVCPYNNKNLLYTLFI